MYIVQCSLYVKDPSGVQCDFEFANDTLPQTPYSLTISLHKPAAPKITNTKRT